MILGLSGCLFISDAQQAARVAAAESAYTVTITWAFATNQDPLAGADTLSLRVQPPTGVEISEAVPWSPTDTLESSFDVAFSENVAEAAITVEVLAAGAAVAVGRGTVAPVDERAGTATLFVAALDQVAWLGSLDRPRWAGGLVATGGGQFLLGGGTYSSRGSSEESISRLQLVAGGGVPAFVDVGALPGGTDAEGEAVSSRTGVSLALLQVDGDQSLLTAGGCPRALLHGSGDLPVSGGWTQRLGSTTWDTTDSVLEPRCFASTAVASDGTVFVVGGYSADDAMVQPRDVIEMFNPATREWDERGTHPGYGDPLVTPFGDGALVCGGWYVNTGDWSDVSASDACSLVTAAGQVEILPLAGALAGAAAVTLPSGEALAMGGAQPDDDDALTRAEDAVWLIDESWSWVWAGQLAMDRAGAAAAAMPDGRVVVAGGATEYGGSGVSYGALSCVEIFDPSSGTSVVIGECNEDDDAGGLSHRAYQPMIAVDPEYGVLIVGGLDGDEPQAGVHFVPFPP